MNLLRLRTCRAWATAALFCATLAACNDATAPLPAEGAPDELTFNMSGYGTGSTSLKLEGARILVWHVPWGFEPGMRIDSVRAEPTTGDWAAFWAAAQAAGVGRWRREYRAENIVDGVGWSLRLAGDGVVIRSGGSNAYPDRDGSEHEGTPTPEFIAFLNALTELTGWDF